jgi:hypothetical protein
MIYYNVVENRLDGQLVNLQDLVEYGLNVLLALLVLTLSASVNLLRPPSLRL